MEWHLINAQQRQGRATLKLYFLAFFSEYSLPGGVQTACLFAPSEGSVAAARSNRRSFVLGTR